MSGRLPARNYGRAAALTVAALACACNLDNAGIDAPAGALNYPIALSLAESVAGAAPRFLYVVNSNYTLKYNTGALQSYDLDALEDAMAGALDDGQGCADANLELSCDASGESSPCCFEQEDEFLVDGGEVLVPSYASALVMLPGGKQLALATRNGDAVWLVGTKADGTFECGADEGERCSSKHRITTGARDSRTGTELAPQPLALAAARAADIGGAADDARNVIFVGHDDGQVSLLAAEAGDDKPEFLGAVEETPDLITNMRVDAVSGLLHVTSARTNLITRIGVELSKSRARMFLSSPLRLIGVAAPSDTRDVAFDPLDPTRALVLVRGVGQSVLFVQQNPERTTEADVVAATRVGAGPSRMALARIGERRVLLVSCFDARSLYLVDVDSEQVIDIVYGFNGPFSVAVDEVRERAYVADFRSSALRVIDLRGLADESLPPPRVIATVGRPRLQGGIQ